MLHRPYLGVVTLRTGLMRPTVHLMTPTSLTMALLAGVLAAAGVSKLLRPAPAARALRALGLPMRPRALGGVELTIAALAIVLGPRVAGPAVAALFVAFAVAAVRLARAGAACGCFGVADERPPGRALVVLDGVAAGAAAGGAVAGGAAPLQHGALALGAALAGAAIVFASRARGRAPDPQRSIVNASAAFLERRMSRRSALVRLAVAGSALSVAPLRYLLYPEPAMAVVVPGSCGGGLCSDGYTAFCCEINNGLNQCPSGTFAGGWWMCTDYRGRRLCAEQGVRYYVDCNRIPGTSFPGGCHCANGTCSQRRVNCNVFRYGQCNTHVRGTTEVVCRMITCTNPGLIPSLNCSRHVAVDNATCGHEAPCLSNAVQLAGAGGV
jgi:hypothetical protein